MFATWMRYLFFRASRKELATLSPRQFLGSALILQTVTFVSLTAPPAFLYAIPVERWMPLKDAIVANA